MKPIKIYFASDQHFGAPTAEASKPRELLFFEWLNLIEKDATALFLLGDLFDFWFEYQTVVPKGFVRILGKLATMRDKGLPIYFFVGNHDLWMADYFEKELNIPVFHNSQIYTFNEKVFFIGHGDGKGPGDMGYKRMKKVFTNPVSKWFFRWLHPDWGVKLGQYLSVKNKLISGNEDAKFLSDEKEWLFQYARLKLQTKHYDYFVFGHRHMPLEIKMNDKSTYFNLGDWVKYFTYGIFDGEKFELKTYKTNENE